MDWESGGQSSRRKFRSQTQTIWTDGQAEVETVREEKRREEERRSKKRKNQRKEDAGAGKGSKGLFCNDFVASEGRQVGSPKRRVRSHHAGSEMKNCTPLRRETNAKVKMYRTPHARTEKNKVSCSGFLPNTKPMQSSCSHHNAFRNQRFQNTMQRQCAGTLETHRRSLTPPFINVYCYVL